MNTTSISGQHSIHYHWWTYRSTLHLSLFDTQNSMLMNFLCLQYKWQQSQSQSPPLLNHANSLVPNTSNFWGKICRNLQFMLFMVNIELNFLFYYGIYVKWMKIFGFNDFRDFSNSAYFCTVQGRLDLSRFSLGQDEFISDEIFQDIFNSSGDISNYMINLFNSVQQHFNDLFGKFQVFILWKIINWSCMHVETHFFFFFFLIVSSRDATNLCVYL
jgi:hypothetical protein